MEGPPGGLGLEGRTAAARAARARVPEDNAVVVARLLDDVCRQFEVRRGDRRCRLEFWLIPAAAGEAPRRAEAGLPLRPGELLRRAWGSREVEIIDLEHAPLPGGRHRYVSLLFQEQFTEKPDNAWMRDRAAFACPGDAVVFASETESPLHLACTPAPLPRLGRVAALLRGYAHRARRLHDAMYNLFPPVDELAGRCVPFDRRPPVPPDRGFVFGTFPLALIWPGVGGLEIDALTCEPKQRTLSVVVMEREWPAGLREAVDVFLTLAKGFGDGDIDAAERALHALGPPPPPEGTR